MENYRRNEYIVLMLARNSVTMETVLVYQVRFDATKVCYVGGWNAHISDQKAAYRIWDYLLKAVQREMIFFFAGVQI